MGAVGITAARGTFPQVDDHRRGLNAESTLGPGEMVERPPDSPAGGDAKRLSRVFS